MNTDSLGANSPHPTLFFLTLLLLAPRTGADVLGKWVRRQGVRIYRSIWSVSTGLDFWPYVELAQRGDLESVFLFLFFFYMITILPVEVQICWWVGLTPGCEVLPLPLWTPGWGLHPWTSSSKQSVLEGRGDPHLCWNWLSVEPICFSCSGAGESVRVADAVGVSHFRVNRNLKNLKGQFWVWTWYRPDEILVLTWSKVSLLYAHSKAGKVNLMCPCFLSTSGTVHTVHLWLVYRSLNALPSLIWSQNIFPIFFWAIILFLFKLLCLFFFSFSAEDITICLMNLSAKPADSFEVVFCLPWVSLCTTGWKQYVVVVCINGMVQKGFLLHCLWCS